MNEVRKKELAHGFMDYKELNSEERKQIVILIEKIV